MLRRIFQKIKRLLNIDYKLNLMIANQARIESQITNNQILSAKVLIESFKQKKLKSLQEAEFKVFSQWGDDGIIQYLIHHLDIPQKSQNFIEFGVENYTEANTRFLLINNNWSGLVLDSSQENINYIKQDKIYYQYDLIAQYAFIDNSNINHIITEAGFKDEVGILSIDIDGNEYWVWEVINVIQPIIVIIEYNAVFGKDQAISIPYQKDFSRNKAHNSGLYFGASLSAFHHLAQQKGYVLVTCTSSGNNAYFVRKDKVNEFVLGASVEGVFTDSKFKESRDENGSLNYLRAEQRLKVIKGLPVVNVITKQKESL